MAFAFSGQEMLWGRLLLRTFAQLISMYVFRLGALLEGILRIIPIFK